MPMPAHQETTATVDHLSRRMWRALEPYHALVYFIPETRQRTDALGLKGGWMSYFGTRAAPLGPVPAEVVTALFYHFHPSMVRRAIPDAWSYASPDALTEARVAGRAGRADRGRPGRPRRGRVAHRRADEANLGRARRRAVLAAGVAAAADPRPDPRGRRLPGPQPARPHLIDSVGRTGYAGVQDRRPEAGSAMAIRRPEADDLRRIARDFHFTIPDERMPVFQALVEGLLGPYDRLDELEEPLQAPRHPRDGGSPPRPEENPFGAWAWRVHIAGAAAGPLAGRTIAIKDNVAVAGVPMHNGTALLDGYVPDEDATVVERVLDAGGTILGKAVC